MNRRIKQWLWVGCAALSSAACGEDPKQKGIGDGEQRAADAAFAVHLSDYTSAGVALLDDDGEVLDAKYLSSGSALPGLSAALHGDITLPTAPCEPGVLTVVARFGGDYVLQVDLAEDAVTHFAPTQTTGNEGAYQSNPQDALCLGGDRALVSRYEPNLTPMAPAIDRGDDLVVLDLAQKKLTKRIDLSSFDEQIEATDGKKAKQIAYARPASIVRVGEHAVVGLSRLTADFSAGAPGALAVVSLSDFSLRKVALGGLKNCGSLSAVSGRDDAVLVSCTGSPYGDTKSAGLAIVSLDGAGRGKVELTFHGQGELAGVYGNPVSLGGARVFAVAQDPNYAKPDRGYVVDLAKKTGKLLFEGKSGGDIGSGQLSADGSLLLVPDASAGVRRFTVAASEVSAQELVAFDKVLPVRAVRALR